MTGIAMLILGFVGLCFVLWPNAMPHVFRGIIIFVLLILGIGVAFVGYIVYVEFHKSAVAHAKYACLSKLGDPQVPALARPLCQKALCDLAWWEGAKSMRIIEKKCQGKEPWL